MSPTFFRPWLVVLTGLTLACTKGEVDKEASRAPMNQAARAASQPSPTAPAQPASQPASQPGSQPKAKAEPNFENPTDTTGLRSKTPCDNSKPCSCVGVLEFGDTALEKIGITAAHLTEGTACVFGDFDGNGFLDAAFLGVQHGEVVENKPRKAEGRVLMFDAVGLRLVAALPASVLSLARRPKVKVGEQTQDALFDPAGDPGVEFVLVGERFGVRKSSGK